MKRRRDLPRSSDRDRWLVSYADFITLLFAFFVVMYSAAQLDKRRAGQLATAIQAAFLQKGSLPPLPADVGGVAESSANELQASPADGQADLKHEIELTLATKIANGDVGIRKSSEGLVISLREVGFFDTGSDKIKASSVAAFSQLAEILRRHGSYIRIEGHTDNVPIHNARFSSNWDLSTARATATIRLLIHYRLDPERMAAAGYAEYHPVASNSTVAGRSMNRRVDIVILAKARTGIDRSSVQ
ncbi:MAG TPA: flagellar motor protein MotB [Terriglobales bacterium]|jgi:chemotaxis protein MotB